MSVHEKLINRDHMKEKLFFDAYGVHVKIKTMTFNDTNWNWDKVILSFIDEGGHNYGLIEHFKEGNDNSTNYVNLEHEDKNGNLVTKRFDENNAKMGSIFVTAEKELVSLMKRKLRGNG